MGARGAAGAQRAPGGGVRAMSGIYEVFQRKGATEPMVFQMNLMAQGPVQT